MYKNNSTPSNNTILWHYLGTKHLYFRRKNNSTPGVLLFSCLKRKKIQKRKKNRKYSKHISIEKIQKAHIYQENTVSTYLY